MNKEINIMAETPVRPAATSNDASPSTPPPGTIQFPELPLSPNGQNGAPRGSKRPSSNLPNSPFMAGSSKSLRTNHAEDNKEFIITDYNPNEVKLYESGIEKKKLDIVKINSVEKVDKHFFYPSSFLCKYERDNGSRILCIHKFIHNAPSFLTYSPSYSLHPKVLKILRKQPITLKELEDIKLEFTKLRAGQTLLINLRLPVIIKQNEENLSKTKFTVNQNTIIDTNNVIVYNFDKYSIKNENNSKLLYAANAFAPNDNEDRSLAQHPPSGNANESFASGVVAADNENFEWNPGMGTPGGEFVVEVAADAEGNNTPGTPTQLAGTEPANATSETSAIPNYSGASLPPLQRAHPVSVHAVSVNPKNHVGGNLQTRTKNKYKSTHNNHNKKSKQRIQKHRVQTKKGKSKKGKTRKSKTTTRR